MFLRGNFKSFCPCQSKKTPAGVFFVLFGLNCMKPRRAERAGANRCAAACIAITIVLAEIFERLMGKLDIALHLSKKPKKAVKEAANI